MARTATIGIPGSEVPQVQEWRAKLAEAEAELRASEEELDHLSAILNPPPTSSASRHVVAELDVLKARQEEPIARMRYLESRAAVLELTPLYERARAEALRTLTESRNKARLPLLRRFSAALDEAAAIGEELRSFDEETVRLGGRNVEHPFGQLLDEPPYRWGEASRVRREVERLEGKL